MNNDIELKEQLKEKLAMISSTKKSALCCMEECAELIQVLSKIKRNSPKFNIANLTMELAHVKLMCEIMQERFNISDDDIISEQILALEKAISHPIDDNAILANSIADCLTDNDESKEEVYIKIKNVLDTYSNNIIIK